MLFMAIPNTKLEASYLKSRNSHHSDWFNSFIEFQQLLFEYARVGCRGSSNFDMNFNLTLHRLIDRWGEIVAAKFDIYPQVDSELSKSYLGDNLGWMDMLSVS